MKRSEMQSAEPSCSASLPPVLDVCCGGRSMWFDSRDTRAMFVDRRRETLAKDRGPGSAGRRPVVIDPDVLADFTDLPFPDEAFWHVVMDPPHYTNASMGVDSTLARCYGMLLPGWEEMLRAGFAVAFRVLKTHGTLIFKWCSKEIPLSRVLALTDQKPLYGHRTMRANNTHWVAFMKQNKSLTNKTDAPGGGRE